MSEKITTFSTKDIGAELLPIITRGLYRDPLDTLREYIQNSIDAKAMNVELTIGADLVSIRDDGQGMDRNTANRAIRLGISDKNPKQDVGFRGIGIYSAFNICARLEIFTRTSDGPTSKISFDFDAIRNLLKNEETRRLQGEASSLCLENLLSKAVWVERSFDSPLATQGTLVVMIGIKGDVYKRLTNKIDVKRYLESVVPLPFVSEFRFKAKIEDYFKKSDYRVVNLTLTLDGKTERIFRPYHNGIFTNGEGIGPMCYPLEHVLARGGNLGFAWVCLNDDRRVLPLRELRGLLIKKFGFSVGGRDQCAHFFARSVFNNRIVGEVIVTHKDLLPNAARTEFEPGATRDALYLALSELASKISSWADGVQAELKAREELSSISPKVFEIVKEIPESERDVSRLLDINNTLAIYSNRLRVHEKTLKKLDPDLLKRTRSVLSQAQGQIEEILTERRSGKNDRGRRIEQALKAQKNAPKTEELPFRSESPENVMDVLSSAGIDTSSIIRQVLRYVDDDLRQRISKEEYSGFLDSLKEYVEENF